MLASFVIPFPLERIDNLLQTVRLLERLHPRVVADSEIVFVCQDRCGQIDTSFVHTSLHNLRRPCMEKCRLLNHGVHAARSENLVILDSDRILPPQYFFSVLENLQKGQAVTTDTIRKLLSPCSDKEIIEGKYKFKNIARSKSNEPLHHNLFAGNVVLKKEDYWRAGGMDEDYAGYGFEDHDMTRRLEKVGVEFVWRKEVELHLCHEGLTYGTGDQKKMFLENGLRYCRKWNLSIPKRLQEEISHYTRNML